jgi:hypothetical protein
MAFREPITEQKQLAIRRRTLNFRYPDVDDDSERYEDFFVYRKDSVIDSDDDPRKRDLIKYVNHVKTESYAYPVKEYLTFSSVARYRYKQYRYTDVPVSTPIRDAFIDADTLIQKAVDKFISDFSGITFLFEPLDLKKGTYDSPIPNFKTAQDGVLSVNLGTLPFISDLKSISDRLFDWARIIDRYDSALSRGLRSVDTQTFTDRGTYKEGSLRIEYEVDTSITYGIVVTGTIPNRLRGALSRFVGKVNLGTAWEFIPFSFLIDYVVPIGNTLDRGLPIENLKVTDSWKTTKRVVKTRSYQLVPNQMEWVRRIDGTYYPRELYNELLVTTATKTTYVRQPTTFDIPDGIKVDSLKLPSLRRLSNVISLMTKRK